MFYVKSKLRVSCSIQNKERSAARLELPQDPGQIYSSGCTQTILLHHPICIICESSRSTDFVSIPVNIMYQDGSDKSLGGVFLLEIKINVSNNDIAKLLSRTSISNPMGTTFLLQCL